MGHSTQACFNATNDDGNVTVGLTSPLAINGHCSVRTFSGNITGRVGIVIAALSVCGVVVDHGIHVAGGDSEKEIGLAKFSESIGTAPIRLRDNADTKALTFQHSPDNSHAKTGVIDVGIACDDDDIAAVPAECVHFGT